MDIDNSREEKVSCQQGTRPLETLPIQLSFAIRADKKRLIPRDSFRFFPSQLSTKETRHLRRWLSLLSSLQQRGLAWQLRWATRLDKEITRVSARCNTSLDSIDRKRRCSRAVPHFDCVLCKYVEARKVPFSFSSFSPSPLFRTRWAFRELLRITSELQVCHQQDLVTWIESRRVAEELNGDQMIDNRSADRGDDSQKRIYARGALLMELSIIHVRLELKLLFNLN